MTHFLDTTTRAIRAATARLVCASLVAVMTLLTACASLPGGVQRPASQARTDVADTRLAAIAGASTPQDRRQLSGMRLLPSGDQALEARVALIRAAEKSVDAQYYLIANDASGLMILRELRDAASRGVRVRLLIDDLHAAGQDEVLAALAAHPNIEVRMFNPLPVRDGSVVSRVLLSMHQFSRVNRRMHNKLLVADNAFAITGGRNIADEYFGRSEPANFIDMDLLSTGPVVSKMSAVFDTYWNSEQAYPIQSLAAQGQEQDALRRRFNEFTQRIGTADLKTAATDPLGQSSVGAQIASGRVELSFGNVRVVADSPAKANADDATLVDGVVMNSTLELLQSARSEVIVASPYFVPGGRTLDALRQATDNLVRVSVMTNSLSTTDEPLVHFGYARHRTALLKMGVSLYELMPGADQRPERAESMHGSVGMRSSVGRLHAKLAVVDHRWLYIGSMNMDRRSAHSNTEMGLIVDSPELAGQVASLLRRERLPQSYQVRLADDQASLQWVAREGEAQVVSQEEPDSTWALRLRMTLASMVIDDELL